MTFSLGKASRHEKRNGQYYLFAGEPGTLSRRMNRLLRRFGQRHFSQGLAELSEEFCFELELVDPAYASQECRGC